MNDWNMPVEIAMDALDRKRDEFYKKADERRAEGQPNCVGQMYQDDAEAMHFAKLAVASAAQKPAVDLFLGKRSMSAPLSNLRENAIEKSVRPANDDEVKKGKVTR